MYSLKKTSKGEFQLLQHISKCLCTKHESVAYSPLVRTVSLAWLSLATGGTDSLALSAFSKYVCQHMNVSLLYNQCKKKNHVLWHVTTIKRI